MFIMSSLCHLYSIDNHGTSFFTGHHVRRLITKKLKRSYYPNPFDKSYPTSPLLKSTRRVPQLTDVFILVPPSSFNVKTSKFEGDSYQAHQAQHSSRKSSPYQSGAASGDAVVSASSASSSSARNFPRAKRQELAKIEPLPGDPTVRQSTISRSQALNQSFASTVVEVLASSQSSRCSKQVTTAKQLRRCNS